MAAAPACQARAWPSSRCARVWRASGQGPGGAGWGCAHLAHTDAARPPGSPAPRLAPPAPARPPSQVTLHEARGLPVWGFPWQSNPYARITLGSQAVQVRRRCGAARRGRQAGARARKRSSPRQPGRSRLPALGRTPRYLPPPDHATCPHLASLLAPTSPRPPALLSARPPHVCCSPARARPPPVSQSRRDDDTSHAGQHRAPVWNQDFQFLVEDPANQVRYSLSVVVIRLNPVSVGGRGTRRGLRVLVEWRTPPPRRAPGRGWWACGWAGGRPGRGAPHRRCPARASPALSRPAARPSV